MNDKDTFFSRLRQWLNFPGNSNRPVNTFALHEPVVDIKNQLDNLGYFVREINISTN